MRRTSATLLLAGLAVIGVRAGEVPASTTQAAATVDALLQRAQELSFAYDYEGALERAEAALRLDPLHYEANTLLRSLYGRLGRRSALEARYRELVAAYPDNAAAYYLLSRAVGSSQAREAYLRLALQIDPNYGPAGLELASRLRDPDQANRALQLVTRALAMMPGDYRAASSYASLLQRLGRQHEAIGFLKQMTAQYPGELRFWTRLWSLELRTVGRDARERAFDRLLPRINAQRHRFMGSLQDMETLARLFDSTGAAGSTEAIELWQSIADRYPQHPRAELALLRALNTARDADTKRQAMEALTERYPASPARYAAYQSIISALVREERYDEAIDLAKSLLDTPDPGYDSLGVGRDPEIARMAVFTQSLECLGYASWFSAAQAPLRKASRPRRPRQLEDEIALAPEAAAAARALATSTCRSAFVFFDAGSTVAHNSAFRTLGIELIERGIELQHGDLADNAPAWIAMVGSGDVSSFVRQYAGHYLELLPYLYLREGRLEDAERAVDRLYNEGERRSDRFYRVAGEVYETIGRLEDAKRAYMRGLSSSPDREFVRAALERLDRALSSTEIVVFDPDEAPRLPLTGTRVRRVHLDIDAPAQRFVGDNATLILLWNVRLEASRTLAERLANLGNAVESPGFSTLSIAVDASDTRAVRYLQRSPLTGNDDQGVAMTWNDLAKWGVEELPTTLLIDTEGRVLARQMSYGVPAGAWIEGWRTTIAALLEP